jgi:hypothetical protein
MHDKVTSWPEGSFRVTYYYIVSSLFLRLPVEDKKDMIHVMGGPIGRRPVSRTTMAVPTPLSSSHARIK